MRAAIAMSIGTFIFVAARVMRTDIPIFSSLWWAWIIMTVVTSGATGWLWCLAWIKHRKISK
jgi:hypothetical protein